MNEFDIQLGSRLRAARIRCEISQKEAAAAVFTTSASVCCQEYGRRSVSIEALLRYCKLYGLRVEKLLEGLEEYL